MFDSLPFIFPFFHSVRLSLNDHAAVSILPYLYLQTQMSPGGDYIQKVKQGLLEMAGLGSERRTVS